MNVLRACLHQIGQVAAHGPHGERARLEAAAVQQVADQLAHVIGLPGNDAEVLAQLVAVEVVGTHQQRVRCAPDRGQRLTQLVPDRGQEPGAHLVEIVERRQVVQGQHNGPGVGALVVEARDLDNDLDVPAVGRLDRDLLGLAIRRGGDPAHQFAELHLGAVMEPAGEFRKRRLERIGVRAHKAGDPPCLAIERADAAAELVDQDDADRCVLEHRLEVGALAALKIVRPGVDDGGRYHVPDQVHRFLVVGIETARSGLVGEEEAADIFPAAVHGHAQERRPHGAVLGNADRMHVVRQALKPDRPLRRAQMIEQLQPPGHPAGYLFALLPRQARGEEFGDYIR